MNSYDLYAISLLTATTMLLLGVLGGIACVIGAIIGGPDLIKKVEKLDA